MSHPSGGRLAMFSSTIIPTISRPTLPKAVCSVLDQGFDADDFEVIVVNDSGERMPDAAWQYSRRVRIVETQRRERSVARNTGAALAHGRYLHFLDDDDWMWPGALQSVWGLAQSSRADWLYGWSQISDRQARPVCQLNPAVSGNAFVQLMAGEWIPLQASFIRTEAFFSVGGFRPTLHGPEDIDLCRRIALYGSLAGTSAVMACIAMGREDSTTDYDRHAHSSRQAREQILSESGVLRRLRESATNSYWQGRVIRAYATSALWNARQRRGFTTASRLAACLAYLCQARPDVTAMAFWRGIAYRYMSDSFQVGTRPPR